MANLLYLVHRLPYPPNKGDKVRSYHLLKHLAVHHDVFLGTFVDDPEDERHIATVASMCTDLHVVRLRPRWARAASVMGLFSRDALSLRYYADTGLQRWVDRTCERYRIDAVIVFSSTMAQYARDLPRMPMLVDFVDVDSAKWDQYAHLRHWPMSWLFRREGAQLLAHERAVAARAEHSFFVTENEAALFRRLAPECEATVGVLCNGVDGDYFSPDPTRRSPFSPRHKDNSADGSQPVVFTGAMDYWPNIDAVTWFVREVLPLLVERFPTVRFHVVGRNPSSAVKELASDIVEVTGTVPDIRPYLQHAAVVVAPLRVARGIQNKVLEAMAMARPVVASAVCAEAIDAQSGKELFTASDAIDHVCRIEQLLRDRALANEIGTAGRQRVLKRYSWQAHLSDLDRRLDAICDISSTSGGSAVPPFQSTELSS
jgi:sugar transferase (PEP-CTERM/EpsH1 system associated)